MLTWRTYRWRLDDEYRGDLPVIAAQWRAGMECEEVIEIDGLAFAICNPSAERTADNPFNGLSFALSDGDYIRKLPNGGYTVNHAEEFERRFELAEEA